MMANREMSMASLVCVYIACCIACIAQLFFQQIECEGFGGADGLPFEKSLATEPILCMAASSADGEIMVQRSPVAACSVIELRMHGHLSGGSTSLRRQSASLNGARRICSLIACLIPS